MLEKYKDGQAVFYNVLMNAVNNNKISHAYLFDSNGNPDVMEMVMSFVKIIMTLGLDDTVSYNICNRIDDGNYLDVKVIDADGMWIKKEQLMDLQSEFSKKAIEGNKKVYIIKSADKMNVQTANSILKFLEEPVDDIIAILVVDNINLILPTIISRCQVIKLNKKEYYEDSVSNFLYLFGSASFASLSSDEINSIIDNVINFIKYIENNGYDTLVYTKKMWHNIFKDREDCLMAVELMINFYYDAIMYVSSSSVNFFRDRINDIEFISNKNDILKLSRKIDVLDRTKNEIKRNLNINLLVDKMIIDMCGD